MTEHNAAEEQAFVDDVEEVADLLKRTYKFDDIAKPLSTRIALQLVAQVHVLMRAECDKLEARIRDLEAGISSGAGYKGVFQKQIKYQPGDLVTSGGSLWHANIESKGLVPGEMPAAWTLCSKHGEPPRTVKQMKGRDGRERA